MYCNLGGITNEFQDLKTASLYDPSTNQWSDIPNWSLPVKLSDITAQYCDHEIVVSVSHFHAIPPI
jgi:hypothetical protein